MTEQVRVLLSDPPWRHADQLPGKGRGASKHYRTMSVDEICAYPIPPMHDDSVLFLWRVASMQPEALKVIDAWGFTLKTEMIWEKRRTCARCKGIGAVPLHRVSTAQDVIPMVPCNDCDGLGDHPHFGMGWNVRASHETCLIATRGKNIRRDTKEAKSVSSILRARMPKKKKTDKVRHSAKPPVLHQIIELMYPGPYYELFAREQREGWTCEGDEAWAVGA